MRVIGDIFESYVLTIQMSQGGESYEKNYDRAYRFANDFCV